MFICEYDYPQTMESPLGMQRVPVPHGMAIQLPQLHTL